jgi:hypothetical protein
MQAIRTHGYRPLVWPFFLGSSPIQWHSKKQSAVSLSTGEAEYRAMTEATKDPILFKRILEELNINVDGPIPMHSDNKSAIEWATWDKPPGKRAKTCRRI